MSDQITDKAIFYIDRQEKAAPGKPFFLYYAPGATHAPHQVDRYWSDHYKGKFDEGWDVYREKVFERQKKLGVIPANAVLPDRNSNIKAWESLSPEEKKLYARFMEVYAGYLTYTDFEIGRLVNHLKEIGQLDNTLIFISIGDNGASKEGTLNGTIDQSLLAKPVSEQKNIEYNLNKIGEIGTPSSTNGNYPLGWAQAADTPFKYWKQDANSEGGTHNPLIVYWPKGIKEKGGIRHAVRPCDRSAAHDARSDRHQGSRRDPRSQAATDRGNFICRFDEQCQCSLASHVQYYYIFGSRSIYNNGWKAELAFPNQVDDATRVKQIHRSTKMRGSSTTSTTIPPNASIWRGSIRRSWLRSRPSSNSRRSHTISIPTSPSTMCITNAFTTPICPRGSLRRDCWSTTTATANRKSALSIFQIIAA